MIATDFIATEERLGAHNYKPLDIVLTRGEGVWVYDVDGRRYMDGLAGYSALNQGHCHPRIVGAAVEQAQRLTLTSRAFRNDQLPRLYERLHDVAGFDMALMMNSGAEAVETAVKAARKWGYTRKGIPAGQAEIIVCANNFHGRTVTIISFSTDAQYRDGFAPYTPGFTVVPYGDAAALRGAITPNTCAFIVEPIQGEAGIIVPCDGYLREVARICREANVLFIADEIQSGLGRAGRLFAFMHEGVRPDAVIVGKALGGGLYPVSAVLASRDVLGVFNPGDHGSTFGGNPMACAIACAALDVIVDERLAERSDRLGTAVLQRLRGSLRGAPIVKDVRGRGLWIGIELDRAARPYCEALMREGLLCKETHDFVIRFAPPLVISEEELDWAVERIERVLTSGQ